MTVSKLFYSALVLLTAGGLFSCSDGVRQSIIFNDGFEELETGNISDTASYLSGSLYFRGKGRAGEWTVTAYGEDPGFATAWQVRSDMEGKYLAQTFSGTDKDGLPLDASLHPMLTAGDSLWHDYTVEFSFKPYSVLDKCGIAFRMQDQGSFYFFGMEGNHLVIKLVNGLSAPHRPFERILAYKPFNWVPGTPYKGIVTLREDKIFGLLNDSITIMAYDRTIPRGRIAILSDNPADFYRVEVRILNAERRKYQRRFRTQTEQIEREREENPKAVVWKKISLGNFSSAGTLRFGDLDNDGEKEMLVVQMTEPGGNGESAPSCITALKTGGEVLWQRGNPDPDLADRLCDVPVRIHDLDNDGWREVIWYDGRQLTVADGRTGMVKNSTPLPLGTVSVQGGGYSKGDQIIFCDLTGKGYDGDLVLKDSRNQLTAYDSKLNTLWSYGPVKAGTLSASDLDGDQLPEILAGLSLLDSQGKMIWDLGRRYVYVKNSSSVAAGGSRNMPGMVLISAPGWGLIRTDVKGEIRSFSPLGYVKGCSVADFNRELPGLETVTVNFWGSQGTVRLADKNGKVYRTFETVPFGSRVLPVNWRGDGEEYFLLNGDPEEGGLYNGNGHKAVVFPDDGHPVRSCCTADLTGDVRDEILVWNSDSLWIYTQSDNPRQGRTYSPVRTPAYNQSDDLPCISLPAWPE